MKTIRIPQVSGNVKRAGTREPFVCDIAGCGTILEQPYHAAEISGVVDGKECRTRFFACEDCMTQISDSGEVMVIVT